MMTEISVLFDEFGTPTFRADRETTYFGGVAISYKSEVETDVFAKCGELFGLSTSQPRKNRTVGTEKAVSIASLVCTLPVEIVVNVVNLENKELKSTWQGYQSLSNSARAQYRGARERPLAQFLHAGVLDNCVINCIANFISKEKPDEYLCSLFVDNWAIKDDDRRIFVERRCKLFEENIQRFLRELDLPHRVRVPSMSMLDTDSQRKRFIDTLASVVSRSFLQTSNSRRSKLPLARLRSGLGKSFEYLDSTHIVIDVMKHMTKEINEGKEIPLTLG